MAFVDQVAKEVRGRNWGEYTKRICSGVDIQERSMDKLKNHY